MTVQMLIDFLETMDKSKKVVVGCEGYTNAETKETGCYDTDNDYVIICDGCFYEEVDG